MRREGFVVWVGGCLLGGWWGERSDLRGYARGSVWSGALGDILEIGGGSLDGDLGGLGGWIGLRMFRLMAAGSIWGPGSLGARRGCGRGGCRWAWRRRGAAGRASVMLLCAAWRMRWARAAGQALLQNEQEGVFSGWLPGDDVRPVSYGTTKSMQPSRGRSARIQLREVWSLQTGENGKTSFM